MFKIIIIWFLEILALRSQFFSQFLFLRFLFLNLKSFVVIFTLKFDLIIEEIVNLY